MWTILAAASQQVGAQEAKQNYVLHDAGFPLSFATVDLYSDGPIEYETPAAAHANVNQEMGWPEQELEALLTEESSRQRARLDVELRYEYDMSTSWNLHKHIVNTSWIHTCWVHIEYLKNTLWTHHAYILTTYVNTTWAHELMHNECVVTTLYMNNERAMQIYWIRTEDVTDTKRLHPKHIMNTQCVENVSIVSASSLHNGYLLTAY